MGVHGLWKLIEPSGKVVPLDTLEGKVLAIDVSIWLHQAIKGFQDAKGAPVPNAHLLTIYHRICKLLYFRIKPIFVFDGGVPAVKRETIAKRNRLKAKHSNEANDIQRQLINTLLKHSAVNKVLSETTKATLGSQVKKPAKTDKDAEDMFILPPSQTTYESSESESESEFESTSDSSPTKYFNIHDIDEKSVKFLSLPADVRHEILTDLKETRKQNSWGRIHELPKQSDDFSTYQMKRLLKRYSIQSCLEQAEQEMGGATLSLNELESLLNDHGVITENKGSRIASDENTRYLYIKDVKKSLERAKNLATSVAISCNETHTGGDTINSDLNALVQPKKNGVPKISESEFQRDLQRAIKLSLSITSSCQEEQEADSVSDENQVRSSSDDNKANGKTEQKEEDEVDSDEVEQDSQDQVAEDIEPQPKEALENMYEQQRPDECHESLVNREVIDLEQEDLQFEKDLAVAIQLSLQDNPTTSNADVASSTNTSSQCNQEVAPVMSNEIDSTPTSSQEVSSSGATTSQETEYTSYIKSLRDSDFESSDEDGINDDILKQQQKSSEKIFSAARNYMMEYGGLTQAGIEEIIGSKSNGTNAAKKSKTVKFLDSVEAIVPNADEAVTSLKGTGNSGIEMITDSDNSDSDFVEVSQTTDMSTNLQKSALNNIEIKFNTNEKLVDDIFDDIFDTTPKENKVSEVVTKDDSVYATSTEADTGVENITDVEDNDKLPMVNENISKPLQPNLLEEVMANVPSSSSSQLAEKDLQQMKDNFTQQSNELLSARGTKDRLATNISDRMCQEAQELLRLFGIPYIVAPMEAEAQCAFLNEVNLTDGTITDDSDIWLFGGKLVYKNFFNQEKQVLEFQSDSIQRHFKLDRQKLIVLAMLVGSDYTIGIPGVGPVTALEVLAAFPPKSDSEIMSTLEAFRKWFTSGKKVHGRGKAVLRHKLKNVELHDGFPSLNVIKAYLEPTVETSRDAFTWGKPDMQTLIDYAREKFGWTEKKGAEVLTPVFKRINDTKGQKRIHDYYKSIYRAPVNTSFEVQNKLSKRVKKALDTIGGATSHIEDVTSSSSDESEKSKSRNKTALDEEMKVLKKARKLTKQKTKEFRHEVEIQLRRIEKKTAVVQSKDEATAGKKPKLVNLHRKEVIPQKQLARNNVLQNRLKAIEVFRKSGRGPGFLKKRAQVARKPKEDAGLSESSSD